ncbi:MAG: CGNR zinc finger domain-containing protein [Actinomycetota bacterium]|nr:CGNR zinc finger domain-containing protein [Actinomycetota bacterium]
MLFAHDTEVSLDCAAALVNTLSQDGDQLTAIDQLERFVADWEITGSRTNDDAELQAVRALRVRLRAAWISDKDSMVEQLNDLLRDGKALPQLVKHDSWDYHLHATAAGQSLATRMAVEAAMALVDVVRTDSIDRLQVCAAADCDDVLIDLSKNHSKRFCSVTCGNRSNVAAYRARRSGGSVTTW